jgi:hypothetical protein
MKRINERKARSQKAKLLQELFVLFTLGRALTATIATLKTTFPGTSAIVVVSKSQVTTHLLFRIPVESTVTVKSMRAVDTAGVKSFATQEVALLARSTLEFSAIVGKKSNEFPVSLLLEQSSLAKTLVVSCSTALATNAKVGAMKDLAAPVRSS